MNIAKTGRRAADAATRTVLGMALTLVLVLVAGCGAQDDQDPVVRTTTIEKPASEPSDRRSDSSEDDGDSPPVEPEPETSEAAGFSIDAPGGWAQVEEEQDHDGLVRSKWEGPGGAYALVDVVDSERSSPAAKAAAVRAATQGEAGYEEISFDPLTVAGRNAFKWSFRLDGDTRVDYFLNECDTGFAVLGSAPSESFSDLRDTFRDFADSLEPQCGEPAADSSETVDEGTDAFAAVNGAEPGQDGSESGYSEPDPGIDPSTANPGEGADFCDTHECIPNYPNGNGTTVQCADGTSSGSGGLQGACSHHGGVE